MKHPLSFFLGALLAASSAATAFADPIPENGYGIRLERYEYPFPVAFHDWAVGETNLSMAYMDVAAEGDEKGAVLLLHGKNFCGAYWEQTARDLSAAGYRVVIPDQVGFGKSSKPTDYQFSFEALAGNTSRLLDKLGIAETAVLGHSMGGMLAAASPSPTLTRQPNSSW